MRFHPRNRFFTGGDTSVRGLRVRLGSARSTRAGRSWAVACSWSAASSTNTRSRTSGAGPCSPTRATHSTPSTATRGSRSGWGLGLRLAVPDRHGCASTWPSPLDDARRLRLHLRLGTRPVSTGSRRHARCCDVAPGRGRRGPRRARAPSLRCPRPNSARGGSRRRSTGGPVSASALAGVSGRLVRTLRLHDVEVRNRSLDLSAAEAVLSWDPGKLFGGRRTSTPSQWRGSGLTLHELPADPAEAPPAALAFTLAAPSRHHHRLEHRPRATK